MAISREEVKKLADLAKLNLSDKEISQYQEQLGEVLAYVEKIKKLDLSNVSQSLSGVAERDIAAPRADVIVENTENFIDYACQHDDKFIISPPVFKK